MNYAASVLLTAPVECATVSHPTTIGHVLWDEVRSIYRDLRRLFVSSGEHSGPALVVDATIPEVTAVLGRRSFAPNWGFSLK